MLNREECTNYIVKMAEGLNIDHIIYSWVYNEPFQTWPASINFHHKYSGGLLHHTTEVIQIALNNNLYFGSPVDNKLLFLAALYHDIGKLEDYELVPKNSTEYLVTLPQGNLIFRDAPHKKLINHIARSAIIAHDCLKDYLKKDELDQILHCILSHHQLKEWGSPVQPQTKMAWLLHLSDNMSARMADLGVHKWST